jgi:hypothetical protein
MGARKVWVAGVLMALSGWRGASAAPGEVLHLIHTSDVRGTVGICG